jgi:hypothetical protein
MILAIDANLEAIPEENRCKFVLLILKMIYFYLSASNVRRC